VRETVKAGVRAGHARGALVRETVKAGVRAGDARGALVTPEVTKE
jgi:hypothetical protein